MHFECLCWLRGRDALVTAGGTSALPHFSKWGILFCL